MHDLQKDMLFHCSMCGEEGNLWRSLESICVAKCGHIFHENCLMLQFRVTKPRFLCPLVECMTEVKKKDVLKINPTFIEERRNSHCENEPAMCSICFNDPDRNPKNLSLTKCGHLYHSECLEVYAKPSRHARPDALTPLNIKKERSPNQCAVQGCETNITAKSFTNIQGIFEASITQAQGVFGGERGDVPPGFSQPSTSGYLPLLTQDEHVPPSVSQASTSGYLPLLKQDEHVPPGVIQPSTSGYLPLSHAVKLFMDEHVPPGVSQASTSGYLPLLTQDEHALYGQNNDTIGNQMTHEPRPTCSSNMLDVQGQSERANEMTPQLELVELRRQFQLMEERMDRIEMDRNEAKMETLVWEMSFQHLIDRFRGSEIMIPNEAMRDLIVENQKLILQMQKLESERNVAKNETAMWEKAFKFLQDKFEDTDMMIPNEATLQIIIDCNKLKSDLAEAQENLGKYAVENSILKLGNQNMSSDLQLVKRNMISLEELIKDHVFPKEDDAFKAVMESLNDKAKSDEILHRQKLNEQNEKLQSEKNLLNQQNENLQREKNQLNQQNENLQRELSRLRRQNEHWYQIERRLPGAL